MRHFPTWIDALQTYKKYLQLEPKGRIIFDKTGSFSEVSKALTSQHASSPTPDRTLMLYCSKVFLDFKVKERANQPRQFKLGGACYIDNAYLGGKVRESFKSVSIPKTGLTKCIRRWITTYKSFDLFTIEPLDILLELFKETSTKTNGSCFIKLREDIANLSDVEKILDTIFSEDSKLSKKISTQRELFLATFVVNLLQWLGKEASKVYEPWYILDDSTGYDYNPFSPMEVTTFQKQFNQYFKELVMDKDTKRYAEALAQEIHRLVEIEFQGQLELNLTGSLKTSLAIKGSDLDLNLSLPATELTFDEVENYLQRLKRLVKKIGVRNLVVIHRQRTRIPLLKCVELKRNIPIDISVGNPMGIPKTKLLAAYANLNPTVQKLLLFVKGWAKARELNLPDNGTINTFCHSMMLLTFLIHIGAIPNLQRTCPSHTTFTPNIQLPPRSLKPFLPHSHRTSLKCDLCQAPLPSPTGFSYNVYLTSTIQVKHPLDFNVLLQSYFEFMGSIFNPELEAFSLYSGGLVSRSEMGLPLPPKNSLEPFSSCPLPDAHVNLHHSLSEIKLFIVEDPVEFHVNIANSGRPWCLDALMWDFRRASHLLRTRQSLKLAILKRFVDPISSMTYIKSGVYTKYPSFL